MLRLTLTFLLFQILVAPIEGEFQLLIFHTVTMHGRFLKRIGKNGHGMEDFARVSYLLNQARDSYNKGVGPTVLYLNVGGVYVDNFLFSVKKSELAADLMNALAPNATCLGNHEFNYGMGELLKFVQAINTPVVASNLVFNEETALNEIIREYVAISIKHKKIAIVAFVDETSKRVHDLGTLEVTDAYKAIKKIARKLMDTGTNIIIALGHRSGDVDVKIAQRVRGVDVVIAGHSLVPGKNCEGDDLVTITKDGKEVPIVHTKYLGKLLLTFDGKGNLKAFEEKPIYIDDSVPQDKRMSELILKYQSDIAKTKARVIANSSVFLKGSSCRNKECNLGNLIADAFVLYHAWSCKSVNWTDSPIALLNAGAIRGDIEGSSKTKGVTISDVVRVMPFVQFLYLVQIDGKDLVSALEYGISSTNQAVLGRFLIVSGLRIVFNTTRPAGSRVRAVDVRCSACKVPAYLPIDNSTVYKIVTIQHLVQGGDGHDVIKRAASSYTKLNATNVDALIKHIENETILLQELDERVIFLEEERSLASELRENLFLPVALTIINILFLSN